jgi:glutamine synthetase
MLAAGLDGIDKKTPLAEPIEQNIFHMSEEERERRKIVGLPGSLEEAREVTSKSTLIRETLGEHIFNTLMANKRLEWDRYRIHVTDHELATYLPVL